MEMLDSTGPDADTSVGFVAHVDHRAKSIGQAFNPRQNSLNFLRLVLALMVLFCHGLPLGGFSKEVSASRVSFDVLGTVAVYGFFGISGFLIARSAESNTVWRYLWQRFLRIFPAFWVCLIVTAAIFGLAAWVHGGETLSGYVKAPDGGLHYVVRNALLRIEQRGIAGTPHGIPAPGTWNGSLWSLFYEFLCYLLLGVLASVGLLKRRAVVAGLTALVWLSLVMVTVVPSLNIKFSVFQNWDLKEMLTLVPIFMTGALLYLYRERINDSGLLALFCFAVFLTAFWLPIGSDIFGWRLSSIDVFAPALAYVLIWLGAHLPLTKVGATNDYSYGVYIYAYPCAQLLAIWGVPKWGYWPYALLTVAMTAPFAIASWWFIERHALRLKRLQARAAWMRLVGATGAS